MTNRGSGSEYARRGRTRVAAAPESRRKTASARHIRFRLGARCSQGAKTQPAHAGWAAAIQLTRGRAVISGTPTLQPSYHPRHRCSKPSLGYLARSGSPGCQLQLSGFMRLRKRHVDRPATAACPIPVAHSRRVRPTHERADGQPTAHRRARGLSRGDSRTRRDSRSGQQ